jgi:hypothetical protein
MQAMGRRCNDNILTDGYMLGALLVEWGIIAPAELDLIHDECEGAADTAQAMKLAAGVRRRLGELLCEVRHITPKQLDRALAEQRRTGHKLGAILIRMALLTRPELDASLAFQAQRDDPASPHHPKLGEILVASGLITSGQLDVALKQQAVSGRRVGEELVAAGCLKPQDLARSLRLQQKLLAALFASVLAIAGGLRASPAAAKQPGAPAVTTEVRPSSR